MLTSRYVSLLGAGHRIATEWVGLLQDLKGLERELFGDSGG